MSDPSPLPSPEAETPSDVPRRDVPARLAEMIGDMAPTILAPEDIGFCAEARDVLERAKAIADRWETAARTAYRKEKERGLEEGRDEGIRDVLSRFVDLQTELARIRQEYEDAVEGMALAAVERFFGEVPHPTLLTLSVTTAVEALQPAESAELAVSPDDEEALSTALSAVKWPVRISVEASRPPGEVELRSEVGRIEISLARHLETVRKLLGRADIDVDTEAAHG